MNDLIGKVKVKLASGEIKTHNWSFRNQSDMNRWRKQMVGKKITAGDLKSARMYGGYDKKAKIISVNEIKSKIDKKRKSNHFKIPTMDQLMRM